MSEKPTPEEMVREMVAAYRAADKVADAPTPGTFAKRYADSIKSEVTGANVDVFIHGNAVTNVLVQEAILRVVAAAAETQSDNASDEGMTIYAEGVIDGARMIAEVLAATHDAVVYGVIEGPAFDRVFDGIVSNF